MGANGSDGQVRVYNLTTGQDAIWATLTGVTAIEKAHYDAATGVLTAVLDGGYHGGPPRLNLIARYEMPAMPV